MDYTSITDKLFTEVDTAKVTSTVAAIRRAAVDNQTADVYKSCFASLDITSLGAMDSESSVTALARKVADFRGNFPSIPNVASVCVYPVFVETVGLALGDSDVSITSVGGGFPSSQTFVEVKMLECAMAEESGADEIDVVLNLGYFVDGKYNQAANELEILRAELDEDTILKVIIESGMLGSLTDIRRAAVIAMAAEADIVKTSTGKNGAGASAEAFVVMCEAVRDYYALTGRRVGVKVAGGVSGTSDAVLYYSVVSEILGEDWLSPEYFRIGASSLANALLTSIEGREVAYF